MIIDAHTHIHFPAYDRDRDEVIRRARAADVRMVTVGTQISSSHDAIAVSEQYPDDIWATAGYHPNHLNPEWFHDRNEQVDSKPEAFDSEKLETLAKHPKIIAIGECGLDYFRSPKDKDIKIKMQNAQKEIFFKQAELAQKLGKPLMIHCRPSKGTDDAYEDLFEMIHDFRFTIAKVLHFYAGSLEITEQFIEAGCYFTFGGVITFSRDYDEIIRMIPLERIMVETDAPYVSPASHRGERNEPAYVAEAVRKLAEIKCVAFDEVAVETTVNAESVLRVSSRC